MSILKKKINEGLDASQVDAMTSTDEPDKFVAKLSQAYRGEIRVDDDGCIWRKEGDRWVVVSCPID